jgi:mycothione reductase
VQHYDLVIIGAGSGNMLPAPELDHLTTAIVEEDRFGGTCLNRGCIPSKMFIVTADAAANVTAAARLGVFATLDRVDWTAVRSRIFGRIDPLHQKAIDYRCAHGVDVYTEPARFVAPKVIEVGSLRISADTFVVATGARPIIPPILGLESVGYHTSDTIMRVDAVPESLIVIGGGFIAAELGYVFSAFGSQVTIIQREPQLLMAEDREVSEHFTELTAQSRRVLVNTVVESVEGAGDGVVVNVRHLNGDQSSERLVAATLLVATGRRPNTDLLCAHAGGLELDEHGHIMGDPAYRTSVPGVWTLADATNHFQLKHMANAETRIVRHNIVHPDALKTLPTTLRPHAVFSNPEVASVGLTEEEAKSTGQRYIKSVRPYGEAAYGWALEDTTSFIKLLADPSTRLLLGAHVLGPDAPLLLQPLLQAMMLRQTVHQLAHDVLYIHPPWSKWSSRRCWLSRPSAPPAIPNRTDGSTDDHPEARWNVQ